MTVKGNTVDIRELYELETEHRDAGNVELADQLESRRLELADAQVVCTNCGSPELEQIGEKSHRDLQLRGYQCSECEETGMVVDGVTQTTYNDGVAKVTCTQ